MVGRVIWFTCEGENPADIENLGEISYYPYQGVADYFYPFKNQRGYLSPAVFLHLKNPKRKFGGDVFQRSQFESRNFFSFDGHLFSLPWKVVSSHADGIRTWTVRIESTSYAKVLGTKTRNIFLSIQINGSVCANYYLELKFGLIRISTRIECCHKEDKQLNKYVLFNFRLKFCHTAIVNSVLKWIYCARCSKRNFTISSN